ncbi:MAG TPA: helix-turn-helix domain-containing protein [Candidatus Binataceae bacterium]|jgi:excisionase family DNA binding protein
MKPNSKSDGADSILTVNELAGYLRVHPATIYRLLKARQLPAFRVGFDWRFKRDTIDEWVRSRQA